MGSFFACNQPQQKKLSGSFHVRTKSLSQEKDSSKEHVVRKDIIAISEFCPNVFVELKYASSDNFMGQVLYTKWTDAYLQKDAALKLNEAQRIISKDHPGLHLLVYDAARPVSIQIKMWNALDSIPVNQRVKFVSNPINKSLHNFACAIDLTLADSEKKPLDMGAGFDDIREIAYPSKEKYFLENGMLTQNQIDNRKILRNAMRKAGFTGIPTEWWHFNACTRDFAIKNYFLIENESQINN